MNVSWVTPQQQCLSSKAVCRDSSFSLSLLQEAFAISQMRRRVLLHLLLLVLLQSPPPPVVAMDGDAAARELSSIYSDPDKLTPLQKHVAFFDRNKDGVIYPSETYRGFRAIGCGVALSSVSAVLINGFLGPKTRLGKFPSPLLPIYVKNIAKGKHGSDSGVYDTEGRFVQAKFEEIFQKHAHANRNSLNSDELKEMLNANRDRGDYTGRIAAWTEWKILYLLCKDKDGLLHKDTVRAAYDGSLFQTMEEKTSSQQHKRS